MKFKTVMLLAVAVGCGLVAMLGVQQVMSGDRKPVDDSVQVYVAAKEITAGTPLDLAMLKTEKWPKAALPKGAITDPKQFEHRALLVKAFEGDILLEAKLADKGQMGASVAIPKGMRVVTVPVNLTLTHSGLIKPGDRVDVVVTYKLRDQLRGHVQKTKTVLEYIQVFATDHMRDVDQENGVEENPNASKNISLLVTPQQGSLLMLATSKGTLQLALRHMDDKELGKTVAVDEGAFDEAETSAGKPEPKRAPEPERPEVLSGLQQFLAQATNTVPVPAAAPASAPLPTPPPVAPVRNTWTMMIFEKENLRREEIDLPAATGDVTTPAAGPADNTPRAIPPVEAEGQDDSEPV